MLRLGRYRGLRGPGLFHIIPIVDSVSEFVDQRMRVTDVRAETALTRDTVPVNVDAIVFWVVWNAEKAILEVRELRRRGDAQRADGAARVDRPARARADDHGARDARPRAPADPRREDEPVGHHGAVGRDPRRHIPKELEDAMSRQAQAERERQARIILGTAETEISEKFAQAAAGLPGQPDRAAPPGDEHALRGDQGEGLDGHRPLVRRRDDGARRDAGNGCVAGQAPKV